MTSGRPIPSVTPAAAGSRNQHEAGFTLIEVLISALLVVLIGAAAAGALIATNHASADQRQRSQADSLAMQDQERLRGLSDQQLGGLNQSHPVTLGGTTFTVSSRSSYVGTQGSSSCSSSAASYYKIVSTVSWAENYRSHSAQITEDSLLTRPVTGDLLTQVTDETGSPLAGVTIAASGSAGSDSGLSDSSGCVLLAGLTAGDYTVKLTPPSGWVDPNGNTQASGTATVNSTSLATTLGNPFHFGNAGSIQATFTNYTSPSAAGGQADGLSWLGSGSTLSMSAFQYTPAAAPSSPATGYTTGSLFPFSFAGTPVSYASNYTVWGGRCAQQAPPAPSNDQFSVAPGSMNTAQNVPEPLLNVQVKSGSAYVQPTAIALKFSGGGCSDRWTATVAPSTGTTQPTHGWLQYPGQPYAPTGTLTVCAKYGSIWGSIAAQSNTDFTKDNPVTVPIPKTSSNLC